MNLVGIYTGNTDVSENKTGSDYQIIRSRTASQIKKLVCEDTDINEDDEKKNRKLESQITQKLKAGKPLTPKELAFLKRYNVTLYRYAVIAETKRKCIENQLRNCRSKEDVQKVQENAMSEINMKSPVAEFISSAAKYTIEEFKKTDAYSKLPATNNEAQSQEDCKNKKISKIGKDKCDDKTEDDEICEPECQIAYNTSFGSYQQAYVSSKTTETMNMLS